MDELERIDAVKRAQDEQGVPPAREGAGSAHSVSTTVADKPAVTEPRVDVTDVAQHRQAGVPGASVDKGVTEFDYDALRAEIAREKDVVDPHEQDSALGKEIDTDGYTYDDATSTWVPDEQMSERDDETLKAYDDGIASVDKQIKTYDDWFKENLLESKEDRKKRERKERSKRIIAAVADGISALGNLYFTHRYAPNAYQGARMTEGVQKGIDRETAMRDIKEKAHYRAQDKLGELQRMRADLAGKRGQYIADRDAKDRAQARRQAQDKLAEQEHEAKMKLLDANTRAANARADKAATDAQYAPDEHEANIRLKNSKATKALTSSATTRRARTGGGSGTKDPVLIKGQHNDGTSYVFHKSDINYVYGEIANNKDNAELVEKYTTYDGYGNAKVSPEAMKQCVTEYMISHGATANPVTNSGTGKSTTGSASKGSAKSATSKGSTSNNNKPFAHIKI